MMSLSKATLAQSKRATYENIKRLALQHNGTIFGGFVRDEFISEYYGQKFRRVATNDYTAHMDKFWDEKYMPELKARLMMPTDVDVSFLQEADVQRFVQSIHSVPHFDRVTVRNVYQSHYESPMIHSIQEIIILMKVGAIPYISDGKTVCIKIDVVIPNNRILEPPFNSVDMLCNAFILTKEGKRLSRCTGTIIDMYSDYERAIVSAQILKDMSEFKTLLVFTVPNIPPRVHYKMNLRCFKRIQKMERRKFAWTFINMPFKTREEAIDPSPDACNECCICSSSFQSNDRVVYTQMEKANDAFIPSAHMHYKCCMKYLNHQLQEADNTEHTRKFVFKCPFRQNIDFLQCKLDIQFVYNTGI
jgi:hypothetical protein